MILAGAIALPASAQKACRDLLTYGPISVKVSARAWDERVAAAWTEVFRAYDLKPDATVIEIAPGDRPKVGLGLKGIHFAGKLYIVEPNQNSLRRLVKLYRELLPKARLIPIARPLASALTRLPVGADFLAANHPLDDMILNEWLTRGERRSVFDDAASVESAASVRTLWAKFAARPAEVRAAQERVFEQWLETADTLRPRRMVISQYESGFFIQQGIPEPDLFAGQVICELRRAYPNRFCFPAESIDQLSLNSERWFAF